MVINNRLINNVGRVSGGVQPSQNIKKHTETQGSFDSILQDRLKESSEIKMSKHAEARLMQRNIKLSQVQKEKICQAVNKAEQKGIKDTLVLVDDIALVVNVKNRTVVTAVGSNELKENVFTNIDGAVIV